MKSKGRRGGIYRPLSQDQIETIHHAALTLLEKVGFTYESGLEDLLEMLEQAGAAVDRDRARVTFPRSLVETQIAKAPGRVILYGRSEDSHLDLQDHQVHLGTGGAAIKIVDPETGTARPSTLQDIYQLARLVDRLDNIHFYLRPCIPTDIPEAAYDVNVFYACFKGTRKHVMAGVNTEETLHDVLEMAAILAGGLDALKARPFLSIITSFAISPLKFCTQSTRIMREANRHHIPVALSCAPMAGSTSPITMAGTLAQIHAEQLAGITVCQLTQPGAPVLYGGIPGMANLRTMGYLGGAVECGMMNAAIHQMAAHVGVPNYNSAGLSDSKIPDAQAGWEKALTIVLAAMGGSNYVHHAAGMLESMLAVAYEQFVIDDEIIGMACRVLDGIPLDAERLALEVIESVGPGGNFMTSPHTLAHLHDEYYEGNGISDRKSRSKWEKEGASGTWGRARRMVERLLSEDESPYIPGSLDGQIRKRFDILL
ncbi:trimethylamine---corrinoid protein Co-methyltransferase [Desulfacinum hydrothermale DSM 13146]|uniref:Trimethylamine---corrinoid protein Co-methyltransferase n=1 Tax=Desulfacinum hydrothermale DSM 13146 TaxID=1121390 RepID=A0A1W1XGE5_9BACT|nr:trimethylamine methyltransferase family protein [Desulfacinum hydrothermale]SMC23053.1 trimethylamine---corrinoid protein Co-methyltransferase [Desulfacinum hydrothermale DSM 13146]